MRTCNEVVVNSDMPSVESLGDKAIQRIKDDTAYILKLIPNLYEERKQMNLRPLSDCIVVKQHDEETKTASGLILAFDGPQKKFQGEVIACGTGEIRENGTVRTMEVKKGDIVMFGEYSGQRFKMDGNEYLMMREKDVIGVIEK